jgi:hypothetical protein
MYKYYIEPTTQTYYKVTVDENQYAVVTLPYSAGGITFTDATLSTNQPIGHRDRMHFETSTTLKPCSQIDYEAALSIALKTINSF